MPDKLTRAERREAAEAEQSKRWGERRAQREAQAVRRELSRMCGMGTPSSVIDFFMIMEDYNDIGRRKNYLGSSHHAQLSAALDSGIDPDSRSKKNHTALWLVCRARGEYQSRYVNDGRVDFIIEALEKKYKDEPKKLLAALTAHPKDEMQPYTSHSYDDDMDTDCNGPVERAIARAEKAIANPVQPAPSTGPSYVPGGAPTSETPTIGTGSTILPPRATPKPAQRTKELIAFTRSGVTYDKLMRLEVGKTVLQHLEERGELPKVFTPEIWKGRREEMLLAWSEVRREHKGQVDIDNVDILMGASRAAKAKIPSPGAERGFR